MPPALRILKRPGNCEFPPPPPPGPMAVLPSPPFPPPVPPPAVLLVVPPVDPEPLPDGEMEKSPHRFPGGSTTGDTGPAGSTPITTRVAALFEVSRDGASGSVLVPWPALGRGTLAEADRMGNRGWGTGSSKSLSSGAAGVTAARLGADTAFQARDVGVGRALFGSRVKEGFGSSGGLPKTMFGSLISDVIRRSGGEEG